MKFFRVVLATIVGFILAQIILGILAFLFFGAMIAASGLVAKKEAAPAKPRSVLMIKLDRPILEKVPNKPFDQISYMLNENAKPLTLREITHRIEMAKNDQNIKGIFLDLNVIMAPYATLEPIRAALQDFKKSGKFIYSYSKIFTQKNYYLSSLADSVTIEPAGICDFSGFNSEQIFFTGALDKLDIKPVIVRIGKYKSFAEPFFRKDMSPANREQVSSVLFSAYDHYLAEVAKSRGIDSSRIRQIASQLLVRMPSDAVQYKLADATMYYDQVLDILKKRVGAKNDKNLNLLDLADYHPPIHKKMGGKKIALIYAVGDIGMGEGDNQSIGGESLSRTIRKARNDSSIKAIVLRVNSPGGSALASDLIWREVMLAKKVKPVVVSMGDVAASGGYYISCAASTIVAEPTTITGSIGVIAIFPMLKDFWNNKLGITFDRVKTGPYADIGNPDREMTPEEQRIMQGMIHDIYGDFITHVAEGRGKDTAYINSIGQGRIWSGTQAVKLGLVDRIGGLDTAISVAAHEAKLTNYHLMELPHEKNPFIRMLKNIKESTRASLLQSLMSDHELKIYNELNEVKKWKGVMARMPYQIDIE